MLLDLILSLGVRRRHTPVFLNTRPMLFLQSRRACRLLESRWVVWVAARHADHPSAAGAVRHKVKGDGDDEFAYVCDACVERALTCRSRAALTRMLAFHILAVAWQVVGSLKTVSHESIPSIC